MDFSSPGLLLVKSKNLNLERYIFCQNINGSRRSNKLTNTDNGRRNLIEYSNTRCKRKSDRANEKNQIVLLVLVMNLGMKSEAQHH